MTVLPDKVHVHRSACPAAFCAFVLFCVAALPILTTEFVPLFDYANHLSRAHVIAEWAQTETFRIWFERSTFLIPNVLADLILVGLAHIVGAELAGRILLLLIAALTMSGVLMLGLAAAGRMEVWPFFSALFLYNEMFLWGFLNYTLGLGILLWGIAAWIFFDRQSRRIQLTSGMIFALATFFSHLVAFGLFAIAIAMLEISRVWETRISIRSEAFWSNALRRLTISAGIFVVPTFLLFCLSPSRSLPMEPRFNFEPFAKLSPITRVLAAGDPVADTGVLLGALVLIGILLLKERLAIDRRLGLVASAFFLAFLLLPYSAMQSFFIDSRVGIAIVLVLLAGVRSRIPERGLVAERHLAIIGLTGLVLLMAVRTESLLRNWSAWDREYRRVVSAFNSMPRGSVLIAASAEPFEYASDWVRTRSANPPHEHIASYATIRRGAIVPSIFAKRGQNPLVFDPPSPSIGEIALGPIPRVHKDYLLRVLAYRASSARSELADAGFADQRVYIVAYLVNCSDWPAALPVVTTHCGETFSVVEAKGWKFPNAVPAPLATRPVVE